MDRFPRSWLKTRHATSAEFWSSAGRFTTSSTRSTFNTPCRQRWLYRDEDIDAFLLHSAPYEIRVHEACERERHGSAHASAQRQQPAVPDVFSLGKPALPRLFLPRPPEQQCAPLRHPGTARARSEEHT